MHYHRLRSEGGKGRQGKGGREGGRGREDRVRDGGMILVSLNGKGAASLCCSDMPFMPLQPLPTFARLTATHLTCRLSSLSSDA